MFHAVHKITGMEKVIKSIKKSRFPDYNWLSLFE